MNDQPALHPTEQILSSYSLGKLDDRAAEAVNQHLEQCPDCRQRVAEMPADSLLDRIRAAQGRPGLAAPVVSSLAGPLIAVGGADSSAQPQPETLPPGFAEHPVYEILRELGQGGMGVVYLAQNKLMGRPEVLKVVSGELINRHGVLDRFRREIRSAARLRHANIVTAYAALRIGESLVLAMEYVEGLDLGRMVKAKGPLPVAHACNFIYQAALGLQHAHERGMVHRDIKPGNLMLARQGNRAVVKVLDFGLAKVSREVPADGTLTYEGQLLGTPDFIAPEQIIDARRADIRADIYSLGCTLYCLLTGGPPFQGTSLYDILQAHRSLDALPLNLVRPDVPVELAALAAKMMAKEPRRRFREPKEVAHALTWLIKNGCAAVGEAKPDIAQPGQPDAKLGRSRAISVPTRPASEIASAPAAAASKPSDDPRTDSIWEGLIDLRETDPLIDTSADTRRRPVSAEPIRRGQLAWRMAVEELSGLERRRWWAAAGVLLLGLVVVWAVVVFTNKTHDAVIETGDQKRNRARHEPRVTPGAGAGASARAQEKSDAGVQAETTIVNSIGMRFTLIPPGEFVMGSPDSDVKARDHEKPQHRVRISKPFYLGVHEATRGQFQQFVDATGYRTDAETNSKGGLGWIPDRRVFEQDRKFSWRNPGFEQTSDHPVVLVTWNDAAAYCQWLSRIEDKTYRVPTEAEWEYACRAMTSTRYFSGDDPESLAAVGNVIDATMVEKYPDYRVMAIAARDGFVYTAPVGQYQPNTFGLYDMHGNAHEWCQDGYDAGYYQRSPLVDPVGPAQSSSRVLRGGCAITQWFEARSANRFALSPSFAIAIAGFRVALDSSETRTATTHTDQR
jgi:formylglycine-generating enzyme required for sulfatase activity/serine/threonine protein kinase